MKLGIVPLVFLNLAYKLSAEDDLNESDTTEQNNQAVNNCNAQAKINFDNCVLWNHGVKNCREELVGFLTRCLPRKTAHKKKKNAEQNSEEFKTVSEKCYSHAEFNYNQCIIWSLSTNQCEKQRAEYLRACLPRQKAKVRTGVTNPTTEAQETQAVITTTVDLRNSKESQENPSLRATVYKNTSSETTKTTHSPKNQTTSSFRKDIRPIAQENSTQAPSNLESQSTSVDNITLSLVDSETASNQSSTNSSDPTTTGPVTARHRDMNVRSSSEEQKWSQPQPADYVTVADYVTADKFSFLEEIYNF